MSHLSIGALRLDGSKAIESIIACGLLMNWQQRLASVPAGKPHMDEDGDRISG